MIEEELREKIAEEIKQAILNYYTCRMTMEMAGKHHSDKILDIIGKAGYRSPEEVEKLLIDSKRVELVEWKDGDGKTWYKGKGE